MVLKYNDRVGWKPSNINDFDDGGAYPEIHMPQFPISNNESHIKKDLVASFLPSSVTPITYLANLEESELVRSKPEELTDKLADMKAALQAIVNSKISSSLPTRRAETVEAPTYIKYVPQQSSSQAKIIRMVNIPKDPCELPKFKINKKIPQPPPSPPAPVIHSPPRKPTVAEQKEWKIPPCISNWKNPKGYTIPLDKRLAADGRGSHSVQINEKFAKLANSLYVADKKAREGVEMRATIQKKLAQKEKEKKEDILKKLAQKAREERAGLKRSSEPEEEEEEERNLIRKDKEKERRRERNMERSGNFKNKYAREREITEQIALNLANPRASSNELQFDQRLIDQSRGLSSGFTEDDEYTVYEKPWKTENELGKNIYRPRAVNQETEDDLAKITGKAFSGAKERNRDGPVPFVAVPSNQTVNEDIFGIDTFLKEAKRSSKRKHN